MKWHPFSAVVTDVTAKFSKVKASAYHDQGQYKIIDQSKDRVAGYTDDASLVSDRLLPVVIFGDHTRVLKYVDEPIALGADGAKALYINPALANARYVYYYLRSVQIKEAGYSRHFKFLKEIKIPIPFKDDVPDFNEQIRIAHLLGKLEGLISQRKQHLIQLDDLLKSVFLEMFGDPVRNEKRWNKAEFRTIISSMRNGLSPSKMGTYKGFVYTLSAITGECFKELIKEDYFSQIHEKYFPTPNDFLLCRGNGNLNMVGKGYFWPAMSVGVIFPDTVIAVEVQPEAINRSFLQALWKTRFIRQQIENNARTTNGAHKINQSVIEKICIIRPPIDLQKQFSSIDKKIESIKSHYQQNLTDLEALYGALSQKALKGELDLSRIELPQQTSIEALSEDALIKMATPIKNDLYLPELPSELSLSGAGRRAALEYWFQAAMKATPGGGSFQINTLVNAINFRLTVMDDQEHEFSEGDFEVLKTWVFEALKTGELQQTFDDAGNRIELKVAQA